MCFVDHINEVYQYSPRAEICKTKRVNREVLTHTRTLVRLLGKIVT